MSAHHKKTKAQFYTPAEKAHFLQHVSFWSQLGSGSAEAEEMPSCKWTSQLPSGMQNEPAPPIPAGSLSKLCFDFTTQQEEEKRCYSWWLLIFNLTLIFTLLSSINSLVFHQLCCCWNLWQKVSTLHRALTPEKQREEWGVEDKRLILERDISSQDSLLLQSLLQ